MCFYCRESEHIKPNCLKLSSKGGPTSGKIDGHKEQSIHIFTITAVEAKTSTDVVRGTISFSDRDVYALFDSGATHNFTFVEFAHQMGFQIVELEVPLQVTTVKGALGCIRDQTEELEMSIKGKIFPA